MNLSLSLAADAVAGTKTIQSLFLESFDVFTVLLVTGSVIAGTVIARCVLEIRSSNIMPPASERTIREMIERSDLAGLAGFVRRDGAFVSIVTRAALDALARGCDARGARDAAELAAAEQSANWFRKLEPLNIVGNLGPLLGLAGTVWGMVLAFSALSTAAGQASPAMLSAGIAKALFHTLLGLLLAVPALTVFGFYRHRTDRLCTRALVISAELTDLLLVRHAESHGKNSNSTSTAHTPSTARATVNA